MIQLLTSVVVLALVQALILNHWLPLVVLARSEKWQQSGLEITTSISACAHVLGTLVLGIPFALAGTRLAHEYENYIHLTAPVFLILFGVIYFIINRVNQADEEYNDQDKRTKTKWIIVFVLMMLLSPCLEIHDLFIAAATYGLNNVLLLALVYAFVSVGGIILLTIGGSKILSMVNSTYLERNRKQVTAFVLVLVGIFSFFIH